MLFKLFSHSHNVVYAHSHPQNTGRRVSMSAMIMKAIMNKELKRIKQVPLPLPESNEELSCMIAPCAKKSSQNLVHPALPACTLKWKVQGESGDSNVKACQDYFYNNDN